MKTFGCAVAVTAMAVATSSYGEDRRLADAFHCTAVQNDIARLECFDKAYGDFRSAAKAPGKWIIQSKIDPLDDTITTLIALNASGDAHPLYGYSQLVIRCQGSELSAWISWNEVIVEDTKIVASRIGSGHARTERWLDSTSRRVTFYPGNAVKFVLDLMAEHRFVAKLAPGTREEKLAVFNVNGLEQTAEPIKDICLSEEALLDSMVSESLR